MATDKERISANEQQIKYLEEYKKNSEANIEALERLVNGLMSGQKTIKYIGTLLASTAVFMGWVISQTLSWYHHEK